MRVTHQFDCILGYTVLFDLYELYEILNNFSNANLDYITVVAKNDDYDFEVFKFTHQSKPQLVMQNVACFLKGT